MILLILMSAAISENNFHFPLPQSQKIRLKSLMILLILLSTAISENKDEKLDVADLAANSISENMAEKLDDMPACKILKF